MKSFECACGHASHSDGSDHPRRAIRACIRVKVGDRKWLWKCTHCVERHHVKFSKGPRLPK